MAKLSEKIVLEKKKKGKRKKSKIGFKTGKKRELDKGKKKKKMNKRRERKRKIVQTVREALTGKKKRKARKMCLTWLKQFFSGSCRLNARSRKAIGSWKELAEKMAAIPLQPPKGGKMIPPFPRPLGLLLRACSRYRVANICGDERDRVGRKRSCSVLKHQDEVKGGNNERR